MLFRSSSIFLLMVQHATGGVYFARDASYSAHPQYAVPDDDGVQRILLCRVAVGRYCVGT